MRRRSRGRLRGCPGPPAHSRPCTPVKQALDSCGAHTRPCTRTLASPSLPRPPAHTRPAGGPQPAPPTSLARHQQRTCRRPALADGGGLCAAKWGSEGGEPPPRPSPGRGHPTGAPGCPSSRAGRTGRGGAWTGRFIQTQKWSKRAMQTPPLSLRRRSESRFRRRTHGRARTGRPARVLGNRASLASQRGEGSEARPGIAGLGQPSAATRRREAGAEAGG